MSETLDIDAECSECGDRLAISLKRVNLVGDLVFSVDPCEDCLNNAKEEGYDEGAAEGRE